MRTPRPLPLPYFHTGNCPTPDALEWGDYTWRRELYESEINLQYQLSGHCCEHRTLNSKMILQSRASVFSRCPSTMLSGFTPAGSFTQPSSAFNTTWTLCSRWVCECVCVCVCVCVLCVCCVCVCVFVCVCKNSVQTFTSLSTTSVKHEELGWDYWWVFIPASWWKEAPATDQRAANSLSASPQDDCKRRNETR